VKTNVSNKTSSIRSNVSQKMADNDIVNMVKQLEVKSQLTNTLDLMKEMQRDYNYFSGGSACGGECSNFRFQLKEALYEYILHADGMLIRNLERAEDIVDYIPPRALYPMWQIMGDRMEALKSKADSIRQDLASLPPLLDTNNMSIRINSTNNSGSGYEEGAVCAWLDDKPFVDLIQARLEQIAWTLNTSADIIPDIKVDGEAGAAAGVFGSAGVGIKPTDQIKILFKVIAAVPQQINWSIKINTLRAATVCKRIEKRNSP